MKKYENCENYEVLDERYGNVQIIVNSRFEELTKLPVVHNNDDTAKLRELCDKIETNLRSLRALNSSRYIRMDISTNVEK